MIAHEHLNIAREYDNYMSGTHIFEEIEREIPFDFDAEIDGDFMTMRFYASIHIVVQAKQYIEKYYSVKVEYCIFNKNGYEAVDGLVTDEPFGLLLRL